MAPSYDNDKSNSLHLQTEPLIPVTQAITGDIYFVITVQGVIVGNYNKFVHFVNFARTLLRQV